jgi:hypothetical protein
VALNWQDAALEMLPLSLLGTSWDLQQLHSKRSERKEGMKIGMGFSINAFLTDSLLLILHCADPLHSVNPSNDPK